VVGRPSSLNLFASGDASLLAADSVPCTAFVPCNDPLLDAVLPRENKKVSFGLGILDVSEISGGGVALLLRFFVFSSRVLTELLEEPAEKPAEFASLARKRLSITMQLGDALGDKFGDVCRKQAGVGSMVFT